jgi:hypothetical protein
MDEQLRQHHPGQGGDHRNGPGLANPKVLFMCAAAVWPSAPRSRLERRATGELYYVVIAASTASALLSWRTSCPVAVWTCRSSSRTDERQHGTLVAAILVVLGVLLLYKEFTV